MASAVAAAWLGAAACGTSPVGVSACKQVEEARCQRAPACGLSLEPPYTTNGSDVDACIRYYDVACLHGLAVADPGTDAVNACVATIKVSPCTAGLPLFETDPACEWLTGLAPSDASTEETETSMEAGEAGDASETGIDAATTGTDAGIDAAATGIDAAATGIDAADTGADAADANSD